MKCNIFFYLLALFAFISCKDEENKLATEQVEQEQVNSLIYPEEKNFKSLRQVTFGGDNAEAYWNFSDTKLVFQSNNPGWEVGCDQIFIIDKRFGSKISSYFFHTSYFTIA